MRYLFLVLFCLTMISSEAGATYWIPDSYNPNAISVSGGTYYIRESTYYPSNVQAYCTFGDCDDAKGYNFTFLNIGGAVRKPFPECSSGGNQIYACVNVWYEKAFNPGYLIFPAGQSFPANSHFAWFNAYGKSRKDFGQWWLQTDPQWADNPYGRNKCSTIRAYGCCATCAAMQLAAWGYKDVNPGVVVANMMRYKDGFVGKSGLQFNWLRLQKIFGCGYKRGVSIAEALQRGMTVQAGVHHNSQGVAGHWVYPYQFAFGPDSYVIYDPMGRGIVDTEIGRYGDSRDNGCWEKDTRMLYRKSYDLRWLFGQPPITYWYWSNTPALQVSPDITDDLITQDYVLQNLGKVAPMRATKSLADQQIGIVPQSMLEAAQVKASTTEAASGAADVPSPFDWETSGFTAWAQTGDVHLSLERDNALIASEEAELIEDQTTDASIEDTVLEAQGLSNGNYTLEITGAPGTYFEVQTYEYVIGNDDPVDRLLTGVIDSSGVYQFAIVHNSPVVLYDMASVSQLPLGCTFMVTTANITAKLASGEYAVQSTNELLPWRMRYTTTTLNPFYQYSLKGTVGPNRTMAIEKALDKGSTPIDCRPVMRNMKQLFDPVAGCVYTKIAGKVETKASSYFTMDGVVVKMTPPSSLAIGQAITVCGVADGNAFIANPSTLTVMK